MSFILLDMAVVDIPLDDRSASIKKYTGHIYSFGAGSAAPHVKISLNIGSIAFPCSVNEYSTLGGTSG